MSLVPSFRARFLFALTGSGLLAGSALATGCSTQNPLEGECHRQAACAENNGWQFSESECEQKASYAFEKAQNAACEPALTALVSCTDALDLQCDDDVDVVAVKKCKSEAEDYAECMQGAAEDEAKEKSGQSGSGGKQATSSSSGGSSSSSGGSSSGGGSSGGGLAAYCDKVSECAGGQLSADSCKSQQSAASSAAEAAGCGDEFEALFACAAELDCSELASYTSKCASEYEAYTSSCGQ